MNVAIIPARGGSKRIANKNIKPFVGRPMISYSIEAAIESQLFDRVIVSTDSDEIANVARAHGAEVPFVRPAELSDDATPTQPVLKHAISWLHDHEYDPDYICCVYATAPFTRPEYIREGFDIISKNCVSMVFSVTSFPFPIFRGLCINDDGRLELFWPEHEYTRSQDLPDAYHDAGQFYWLEVERFQASEDWYARDAMPVVLPRYLVQDIDTLEDWQTAERMHQALLLTRENPAGEQLTL